MCVCWGSRGIFPGGSDPDVTFSRLLFDSETPYLLSEEWHPHWVWTCPVWVRGSVSPAWLGSCIGCFFLCPQPTHTSLVFALAPSIPGISEHLSLSPQSSLLWKVKKELILGRRLLLASCRGSCRSLKSEMPEGSHIRREGWRDIEKQRGEGAGESGMRRKGQSFWCRSWHPCCWVADMLPTLRMSEQEELESRFPLTS